MLGVTVRNRTAPPSRGRPGATDALFLVGKAASGPIDTYTLCRSLDDFTAAYGVRATANAGAYDYLDTFFREGGTLAFFVRYASSVTPDVPAALALLPSALGPGQVTAVDVAPAAVLFGNLLDHAAQNNRFALLDAANGSTVAAMTTLVGTMPATNRDYGAIFGSWVNVPAPDGSAGIGTRQVPLSAVVAGLLARSDGLGNPNRAPAGRDFLFQYVTSLTLEPTDSQVDTLLTAGLNMAQTRFGLLQLYGFQTTIGQSDMTPFWQANCSRTRMWITFQAQAIGEHYMFKPIDGRGLLARALRTDLEAMLLGLYAVNGLFGETTVDAFSVEVGASVNQTQTIAQGELHAVCQARLTLHAKSVIIDLVSIPVAGTVAA